MKVSDELKVEWKRFYDYLTAYAGKKAEDVHKQDCAIINGCLRDLLVRFFLELPSDDLPEFCRNVKTIIDMIKPAVKFYAGR